MPDAIQTLCPACFHDTLENGRCAVCGYVETGPQPGETGLPPFTILHGKYLLGHKLGQGGFGITYCARDQQTGALCCVKEYYPAGLLGGRGEDGGICLAAEEKRGEFELGRQQFLEEAGALQGLRGNIAVVDILDYFEEKGTAYFVMELLDGCNLRAFCREHSPEQNFRMALQMLFLIGSGLVEVHRFGMLHGDISPENIIITRDGDIKLIDFGAARSFTREKPGARRKIYLKPHYAPYEQYLARPCQGPWTDLYALAATFYFLVSGQYVTDARARAKGESCPSLCGLSPLVSAPLSDVLDHALAFDYHDRYKSLTDFMADLNGVVRPEDYNIDLKALMPQLCEKTAGNARLEAASAVAAEAAEKLCSVEELPEPKGLAAFFRRRKHHRMAWLELTIQDGAAGGGLARRRWLLEPGRDIMVGRRASSDVLMPVDNFISRDHCVLRYSEEKQQVTIRDVSRYGSYLADGRRMEPGRPYTLKNGDGFYVYTQKYRFKVVIET